MARYGGALQGAISEPVNEVAHVGRPSYRRVPAHFVETIDVSSKSLSMQTPRGWMYTEVREVSRERPL